MKKSFVIILLLLSLFSLSARPQFFLGGGAEWGRVYPSSPMKEDLEDNKRYYQSSFKYMAFLIPKAEVTLIPYSDFPLGLTASAGYGFITGVNEKLDTSNSAPGGGYYRYGSDEVLLVSGGLTYIHLAESEKYFSVCGNLRYNWNRYTLSKRTIGRGVKSSVRDNTVINEHSLSAGIGIMGRYDARYFRIDAMLRKDIDFGKGISSLWEDEGYSFTVSMTIGWVFTLLNQNQFMR